MEEFLRSLHRILPNKTFISLEMAFINQYLRFYIVAPKNLKSIIESQLYANYPEAEVEEVEDYLPTLSENMAFSEVGFKKGSVWPIATYKTLNSNMLRDISALLSKSEPDDKIYFQIILQKVGSKWWERGVGYFLFWFFGKKTQPDQTPTSAFSKTSQDLFQGKLRVIFTGKDKTAAENQLATLLNIFKVLKSPSNELKKKNIYPSATFLQSIQARLVSGGELWSPDELATIYHFPYKEALVTNVVSSSSKKAPPPDILPFENTSNLAEISLFGETNYHSEQKRFGIKRFDRRRHLYVIGKTGSGKSKLLELLLISDILSGQGCCLLDPHGDLADELLMFIPKERINDVVYVNPSDRDFPIGFNPLEPVSSNELRQHLSTFFIAIFKKMFSFNWNPRIEHLVRYITLALLETPDSNILGIPRILSDTAFRQRVIKQIQDPIVKSFWINEFSAWNDRFSNEAVIPLLNKVGQFISNPIVRNVVGQRQNVLNFSKFMNEGKIIIINISKGKLGDDNSALLGSMFITKLQQAALSRANIPEEERRDFYFYVDEFQNFATDAFSSILSEARKYRLNLTIAHQYIAQLPEDVKATTFGNVGSIVAFAVGADDANYLSHEFAPVFSAEDLINLNLREMYVKMSVDGRLTKPFSAKTINVPKPTYNYASEIINHSRLTYGKNRIAVENEIARWSSTAELLPQSSSKEEFPEPII